MLLRVAKALLGHYRRHPLQIFLVWLGLTLGVSLLVGVLAINHHAKMSYNEGEKLFSNPFPNRIRAIQDNTAIPQAFYINLRRAGYTQCMPVQTQHLETKDDINISVVGIDPVALMQISTSNLAKTDDMLSLMRPPFPILISQPLASYFSLDDGDYIELQNQSNIGPVIIDKAQRLSGSRIFSDVALTKMLGHKAGFDILLCGEMSDKKKERLERMLPRGLQLETHKESGLTALTNAFHINLLAMGMLSFVVGLFIFYQAMSLSFIQRQPLVGTLRQIGVSTKELIIAMSLEVFLWVIIGWVSGNFFGLLLANELMPTVSNSLYSLYNADVDLLITWSWNWSYQSLWMAILGCVLACGWPLYRLLSIEPIRLTARLSLARFAGKEFEVQAIIAGVFCVAAYLIKLLPHSHENGFMLIGFLMISVGLLTPYIIWKFFDWLSYRLPSAKARWFFSDSAASLSYRGVAAMAFMLALASNIGVETMVGSFRATTNNWLEQRLAADIYIEPSKVSASRISHWLEKQPEVESVWRQWKIDYQTEYGNLEILSSGPTLGEKNALTMKVAIPEFWYSLHHSRSLLISESMALKWDMKPGDYLDLPAPMGDNWQISGVYYDYGNPYNQLLLSHSAWLKVFGGQGKTGIGVVLNDTEKRTELIGRVLKQFRLPVEQVNDNNNIQVKAMKVFDRTFIVTGTLGNLTLVIAVFGLFFATLVGEVSRQRQTALLRCLGLSGKELILLGGLQLLTIGLFTILIALPLGIILSQLLIDIVMKYAFGWTMQINYFPMEYVMTFAWTLLALTVAGAATVWRVTRRQAIISLRESL
ncbi:FtsX-like permease family protein [Aliivibrio finisterrensis]|uniref:ABC transporter permease n=1 Tax=Aliivibrio finisterrensis TaxID=511998 RepID=UPI00101FE99A|nr:ABC transporter permease [Aliivibrio finisterrensis]RYU71178.1 FtsX-like permease family protein [Aliivibrio finisterrensis]RYU74907.1 FtsX-like permease family protein [Aliivibrio finisterrensis]RYU77352.1 FtsX-like permease family protein [Aliivibrio finisterrensis]